MSALKLLKVNWLGICCVTPVIAFPLGGLFGWKTLSWTKKGDKITRSDMIRLFFSWILSQRTRGNYRQYQEAMLIKKKKRTEITPITYWSQVSQHIPEMMKRTPIKGWWSSKFCEALRVVLRVTLVSSSSSIFQGGGRDSLPTSVDYALDTWVRAR